MKKFFEKYSSEQAARVLSALFLVLGFLGFSTNVSPAELANHVGNIITAVMFIATFVANLYGYFRRYNKGDVTPLGFRKTQD